MTLAPGSAPCPLDDSHVAAATLASLPLITPGRLRRLLEKFRGPVAALAAVTSGNAGTALREADRSRETLPGLWRAHADPQRVTATLEARRSRVWLESDADFPIREPVDDQPAVLLGEGERTEAFEAPRVAIVGTRAATPQGLADAHDLGAALTRAGCTIVSGLAIGIDAAAHEGALSAGGGVIGVVATGLDVVYPRHHERLFQRVRESGVIVSEHGHGVEPEPMRFPVRNRIIAALADVVVIVEATASGGTRHTARYADEYGRTICVVPGSRRNPAAALCNDLLRHGAVPVIDPGDVLVAVGLATAGASGWTAVADVPLSDEAKSLLDSLGGEPCTVDDILSRSGLAIGVVGPALRELEAARRVVQRRGLFWPV